MKSLRILLALGLLVLSLSAQAIEKYKAGDLLYVWLPTELSLGQGKSMLLGSGTQVRMLKASEDGRAGVRYMFPARWDSTLLSGRINLAQVEINNPQGALVVGEIFDGMLLPLPPPKASVSLLAFLRDLLGPPEVTVKSLGEGGDVVRQAVFPGGELFEYATGGSNDGEHLFAPAMEWSQGLLMALHFYPDILNESNTRKKIIPGQRWTYWSDTHRVTVEKTMNGLIIENVTTAGSRALVPPAATSPGITPLPEGDISAQSLIKALEAAKSSSTAPLPFPPASAPAVPVKPAVAPASVVNKPVVSTPAPASALPMTYPFVPANLPGDLMPR